MNFNQTVKVISIRHKKKDFIRHQYKRPLDKIEFLRGKMNRNCLVLPCLGYRFFFLISINIQFSSWTTEQWVTKFFKIYSIILCEKQNGGLAPIGWLLKTKPCKTMWWWIYAYCSCLAVRIELHSHTNRHTCTLFWIVPISFS